MKALLCGPGHWRGLMMIQWTDCMQAVLAESKLCPFTKTSMAWEQCTVLTHSNIDRYRDRIKSM